MQSSQQYYSQTTNYGDYQYVTLDELIDNIMLEALEEEDHYLRNTKKFLLQKYGKEAVRELNFNVDGSVRPLLYTLDDTLQIVLPQDYVDYTYLWLIDKNGMAVPLNVNPQANTAASLLLDNDGELVFDSEGQVVETTESSSDGFAFIKVHWDRCGGYFQKDFSKFSKHGEFKVDVGKGVINFSSNLRNAKIILEYISDGLAMEDLTGADIRVHKYLMAPVMDLIYLKAIERRRSVPQNEKDRALRRYNRAKHRAKMQIANFNIEEISKAFRGMHKWVKF